FSFSHRPLGYISRLAFFCVIGTFLAALYYLGLYFYYDRTAPSGFMSLLLAVLFLGSVQLVCLSILAEYLGHMYDELKGRPRYITRDIVDNRNKLNQGNGAMGPIKAGEPRPQEVGDGW